MKPAWLRPILIAVSIIIYTVLAHYSNAADAPNLGATLAVAPLLLAVLIAARRASWSWLTVPLALLLTGMLLRRYWQQIEYNFSLLYLLQQCGAYLLAAFGFGRSLRPDRIPLCTQWAALLHRPLPDEVQRYTRAVTAAWTLFFAFMGILSAVLYVLAPLRIWSVFSNFLTLPLAGLMLAVEYSLRRRIVPSMPRFSIADTVRAYFTAMRDGTAPRW